MRTLRVSQFTEVQANTFRVELSLDGSAPVRTRFQFVLSPQDQEDLRWYLEDYLQYPLDPAPTIAARIEQRMAEVGKELFEKVFQSNNDARDMWAILRSAVNDTRIEIVTEVQEATSIPWELLRDLRTDEPLALNARAFVRAPLSPVQRRLLTSSPSPLESKESKIRILLVICRPRAGADVPFRSVASRMIKSLSDEARDIVQLDVLRPPTYEQLGKVLREAKSRGKPYHVLHFDGHGTYEELIPPQQAQDDKEYETLLQQIRKRLSAIVFGTLRAGKHGYLLFENPQTEQNITLVHGSSLGKLLVENDVPTLVLNACQSAFAEAPTTPLAASEPSEVGQQVRAFGSLAQEVMDTGVTGVVAMRYILYVETAKRFVADLYAALAQGESLGEAVTFGRKQLAMNPQREIAYKPIALQDWCVPIVYESSAIELFPRAGAIRESPLRITIDKEMTRRGTEIGLPPRPDVGFFGRDETLLALDRAFDTQPIVLLHAFAGSGKTTTAVEFARWYALTGGVKGSILFTSFEQYKPLARVLDTIGQVFGDALERSGANWLARSDEERRDIALQVLGQIPMLWIWDNIEPIAGFPTGTKSTWSDQEQSELKRFLSDARDTKVKFLLTSRRDEDKWLGDLPRRIVVPPMPMQERVQLARALAEKFGHRITHVEDWRPLLQFTQGNPLTITVLVGQALRDGLRTRDQIDAFVEKLRRGEAAFPDEESEGRSKSLGASLSYGFENAFTETERKQLALLHFFQGFVDVDALRYMGDPEIGNLPEVRSLTREAGIALLDRAAEIGLLTAHGSGYYSIHPVLPWYFKSLFEQYYSSEQATVNGERLVAVPQSTVRNPQLQALRAFVEAIGQLGNYYHDQYIDGNRDVIGALTAEEANLLHARQLARANAWWALVITTMQGLHVLYDHTGRRAKWAALVNEIVPDFIDPATDAPLAGREEQWVFVTDYRVRLGREARQWAEAERLQRMEVEWNRERAAPVLAVLPIALDHRQGNAIRTLAVSLEALGNILREQGKPECAKAYEEAIPFCQQIDDKPEEAVVAFNLGHAYLTLPALRDLAQAEHWYRCSLNLRDERDNLGRGRSNYQLGHVGLEQFRDLANRDMPKEKRLDYLIAAEGFYRESLALLPSDAVDDLAVAHNGLAVTYQFAGDLDRALLHYREAIRYEETQGNLYGAGQMRFNVAVLLGQARRLADAHEYALAALRDLETFGDRAAEDIEKTKGLIAEIEEEMRKG